MNHPQPLIQSSIPMSGPDLETLVNYIKKRVDFERTELGWQENRAFTAGSLFDKWSQFERQAEQDFKQRATAGSIYEDSNLTQNLPYTIASQHHDRITRDLLDSPRFFDIAPEGEEDARLQDLIMALQPPEATMSPGVQMPTTVEKPTETLMRLLFQESRRRGFADKLSMAIKKALFIGHSILLPEYERRTAPRRVALSAWLVNGQTIRDSKGEVVMADRPFIADPEALDPAEAELVLQDDPAIRLPAGTIVTPSKNRYGVTRMETITNGCTVQQVYWADFVIPQTATWDSADFRGHFYRSSVDSVMSGYAKQHWTKEGFKYFGRHKNGELARNRQTATVTATEFVEGRGETFLSRDNNAMDLSLKAPHQRSYLNWCGLYDADGDGYAEPIFVQLDWEDQTVVRLEAVNVAFPWLQKGENHPYECMTVFPVEARWYGLSYYEVYKSWHEFTDLCWNRGNLDIENSGNIFFRNRGAFVNPLDADNLGFRTPTVFDLMAGVRGSDAFGAVQVTPMSEPVFAAMDRTMQRIQSHGSTMGAADPQTSSLPATDTLGGLNKVLEQGDVFVSARERELVPALNRAIRQLANIKVHAIKSDPKESLELVGKERGQVLMQFLEQLPGHISDYLEVNLSKAFGTGQTQLAQTLIGIAERWINTPSLYKKQFRPLFERVFRGLGVNDPKTYLDDPEAFMMMLQQQQTLAGQPQGGNAPESAPAAPVA